MNAQANHQKAGSSLVPVHVEYPVTGATVVILPIRRDWPDFWPTTIDATDFIPFGSTRGYDDENEGKTYIFGSGRRARSYG